MAEPLQNESPRLKALQSLAKSLPVANQRVAQGQQAARDMQLQQAIQKAPVAQPVVATAQSTGAALVQNAGQQQAQQAEQQVQQGQQVGELGLAQQAQEAESRLAGLKSGAREQEMGNVERLASISEKAKQELYDDQMQFKKDEAGRTLMNERQLMDYAKLNAQNDEQLKNYEQMANQLHDRKIMVMETAQKQLIERLNFENSKMQQKQDQNLKLELEGMIRSATGQIQREKDRAANRKAGWTAGGAIVGGVIGGVAGGPGGAKAGAQGGGAAGGAMGGNVGGGY